MENITRLSIEELVTMTERNSFKIPIGRSLTQPGNPAVMIDVKGRHLKLIGETGVGKSSMAAALISILAATHDPDYVQFALLDSENQTGRVFEGMEHIIKVQTEDGRQIPLHAQNHDQVMEYLGYITSIISRRSLLPESDLVREPLLIVYIEDFLSLKDRFTSLHATQSEEERSATRATYLKFIYHMNTIVARALKVGVQLLLCTQGRTHDDLLKRIMENIPYGIEFYMKSNTSWFHAQENYVGKAIVLIPGSDDFVLVPQFNLRQQLIEQFLR